VLSNELVNLFVSVIEHVEGYVAYAYANP